MVVSSSLPCKGVLKDVLMWASRVKNWVEVGMGCLWMSCFGSIKQQENIKATTIGNDTLMILIVGDNEGQCTITRERLKGKVVNNGKMVGNDGLNLSSIDEVNNFKKLNNVHYTWTRSSLHDVVI